MGVNISLHVHQVETLLNEIEEHIEKNGGYREGALPVREWFLKVAPEFGVVEGNKFLVVWNEYYEVYNPASNFLKVVDDYFFPNHEELGEESERGWWDGFWSSNYTTESEGVNSSEILAELFPEEFGYEGKFSDYGERYV